MKMRNGFVSNSSSSSFIIRNMTGENKSVADFVRENPQLIEEFREEYDYSSRTHNQEKLIESAETIDHILYPGKNCIVFGDEDGSLIGGVFDYILRDGGCSNSFEWEFDEGLR